MHPIVCMLMLASSADRFSGGRDVDIYSPASPAASPAPSSATYIAAKAKVGAKRPRSRREFEGLRCTVARDGDLPAAAPKAVALTVQPDPQLAKAYAIIRQLRPAGAGEDDWSKPGVVRVKHYDELNGTIVFNLRVNLPKKDVSWEMLCKDGIANVADGVCCHKQCGGCGSASCGGLPGGARNCCSSKIKRSGRVCGEKEPPCLGAVEGGTGSKGYLVVQSGKTSRAKLFEQEIGVYPRGSGCGNWGYGQGYLGYADPRLFEWHGKLWVLLNGCSGRGRCKHDLA